MKYNILTHISFLFLLFCSHFSFSQEQLGLRIERYSGTGSIAINPVNTINNPLRWDLNLFGMGGYASTNYSYLKETNAIKVLLNAEKWVPENKVTSSTDPNAPIIVFNNSPRLKYADGLFKIHGPAFNYKINDDIGIGIFMNIRGAGGVNSITPAVNFKAVNERPFREYFDLTPSRFLGMLWSEIGVNYAQRIEIGDAYLGIGTNIKYLQGYQAVFLNTTGIIKTSQFPNDTFSFVKPSVEYSFTSDILGTKEVQTKRNGSGLGFDLGAQYIVPDEDSDETDHKLILGISISDIGRVHFNKNAEAHLIETDKTYTQGGVEFKKAKTYKEIVETISKNALGDPQKSFVNNQFNIGVPAAISLQADYKIYKYNYVGAIFTQRLPFTKNTNTRPNSIAIHYRFEHRWGAIMLPISVVNYKLAQVGLAVRLAYLTIGSDNVGSLFGKRNVYGSDFYFALKFNPFKLGLDFGQGSKGGRKSSIFSRNKVKCPTF